METKKERNERKRKSKRAERRAKAKAVKKSAGPKGQAGPPKNDPEKQRATVAHLGRLHQILINQMKGLEQRVADSFGQEHRNVQALKSGLDSSEFNLRAQQKVINALSLEIMEIYRWLEGLMSHLNKQQPEGEPQFKIPVIEHLETKEVAIPTEAEDGEKGTLTLKCIDWAFYHAEVEKELKKMVELEKAEQERRDAERAKLEAESKKAALEEEKARLEEQLEDLKREAKEAGNNPEEVQAEAEKVLQQFKRVSEELGKMVRGEPHDQQVIAEAQQMIEEDERKHPDGATIFGG